MLCLNASIVFDVSLLDGGLFTRYMKRRIGLALVMFGTINTRLEGEEYNSIEDENIWSSCHLGDNVLVRVVVPENSRSRR